MLSKPDRVRLIFEVSDRFEGPDMPWDRINVILTTFGMEPIDSTDYDVSIAKSVSAATDDQLSALAEFFELSVTRLVAPAPTTTTVKTAEPLFVFASHLASHRRFVGQVREELSFFAISLFVAHDSIADDATWHHEIEKGLDNADAGVVFLHEGFIHSQWCDQEVGWLLGRHVPVIPLNFGITPYGPIGKLQARPENSDNPREIAERILTRLTGQKLIRSKLTASLIAAIQQSSSYNSTDRIWAHLRNLECDANQCQQLLAAVRTNDQIYYAKSRVDASKTYPHVVLAHVRAQPEANVIKDDIDEFEAFLIQQDANEQKAAAARKLASPVPPGFASRPTP